MPQARLPITPSVLRKLKTVWEGWGNKYDRGMWWALATTTFFTFCRLGEMVVEREDAYEPNVHLSFRVDNAKVPSVISLHLRHSKTEPTFKGVKVYIGRTGNDLCPVSALLHYLTARGNHPGPLFVCENGKPLIKSKFVAEVRVALTEANLPTGQYAGHSFRICGHHCGSSRA